MTSTDTRPTKTPIPPVGQVRISPERDLIAVYLPASNRDEWPWHVMTTTGEARTPANHDRVRTWSHLGTVLDLLRGGGLPLRAFTAETRPPVGVEAVVSPDGLVWPASDWSQDPEMWLNLTAGYGQLLEVPAARLAAQLTTTTTTTSAPAAAAAR